MIAGREMDALVAEKVFGIKKVHYHTWDDSKSYPQVIPSNKPWRTHQIDAKDLPRFSTDIAAAWEVVEKLRSSGHWLHLSECKPSIAWHDKRKTTFLARVCSQETTFLARIGKNEYAEAGTAPLAICLAALAAVGVEVPA